MAPALIAFALVILAPFATALGLAFTRYDLRTPEPVFVGLANFRAIWQSPQILGSFWTTFVFVSLATAFTVLIALGWALISARRVGPSSPFTRGTASTARVRYQGQRVKLRT
jgi:multiple sugar transport system permease protein